MASIKDDIRSGIASFFNDITQVFRYKSLLAVVGIYIGLLFLLHVHFGGILCLFPGYYEQLIRSLHRYSDLWGFAYDFVSACLHIGMSFILCAVFLSAGGHTKDESLSITGLLWGSRSAIFSLCMLMTLVLFMYWELVGSLSVIALYGLRPWCLMIYYILVLYIVREQSSLAKGVRYTAHSLLQLFWHHIGWVFSFIMIMYVLPYILPNVGFSLSFLHYSWLVFFGSVMMTLAHIVLTILSPILYVLYAYRNYHTLQQKTSHDALV